MNLPDKCPFCGEGPEFEFHQKAPSVFFACDSFSYRINDTEIRTNQSTECKESERAKLRARVTELEARCKRLETAARDLYLDCIASGARWTKQQTKHMHALRDVLGEKPCGEPCGHCFRAECECCDADVVSDMGDR